MVHKRKKSTTTENKMLWVNNNFFHFLTLVRDIYFNEFLKVLIRFSEEKLIKPTIHKHSIDMKQLKTNVWAAYLNIFYVTFLHKKRNIF